MSRRVLAIVVAIAAVLTMAVVVGACGDDNNDNSS